MRVDVDEAIIMSRTFLKIVHKHKVSLLKES